MKKRIAMLLTVLLALGSWMGVFAEEDITVFLDGTQIQFDVAPVIMEDRTMVPLRKIAEALEAEVVWDGAASKITLTKGTVVNELTVGDKTAYKTVEGTRSTIALEAAPVIVGERTLVPLRYISESFDMDVVWVAAERKVLITSKEQSPQPEQPAKPTESPKPAGSEKKSIDFSKDEDGSLKELHSSVRYSFEQEALPQFLFGNQSEFVKALKINKQEVEMNIAGMWDVVALDYIEESPAGKLAKGLAEADGSSSELEKIYQELQQTNQLKAADCFSVGYEEGEDGKNAIILEMADIDELTIASYIGIVVDKDGNIEYYLLEQQDDKQYKLCGIDKEETKFDYGAMENDREAFVKAILAGNFNS